MSKEDIIELAKNFWKESIEANSYYDIIKQYGENYKKYYDEMKYSSAFYSVTYNALQEALVMKLAKLYDRSKNAINIMYLLEKCRDNIGFLPKCVQHIIKQREHFAFSEYVESEKNIRELFGVDEISAPIVIELSSSKCIELYIKVYHSLKPKIDNLVKQRNKIYAHNDKELCFNIDDMIKNNPISYNDIEELIDYALDISRFIIGCLENICKPKEYKNISDWASTLRLVKAGLQYYEDIRIKKIK